MEKWDVQILCDGMSVLADIKDGKPEHEMLIEPDEIDWERFLQQLDLMRADVFEMVGMIKGSYGGKP